MDDLELLLFVILIGPISVVSYYLHKRWAKAAFNLTEKEEPEKNTEKLTSLLNQDDTCNDK